METIKMLAANINDDATLGRVVRAMLTTTDAAPTAPAEAPAAKPPTLELSVAPEIAPRKHGHVFSAAYAMSIAAAVRAAGGRVQWSARHIKENVPGYQGSEARSIGNALAQWARGWRVSGSTYYGVKVTGVRHDTVPGYGALAVYTIEST